MRWTKEAIALEFAISPNREYTCDYLLRVIKEQCDRREITAERYMVLREYIFQNAYKAPMNKEAKKNGTVRNGHLR